MILGDGHGPNIERRAGSEGPTRDPLGPRTVDPAGPARAHSRIYGCGAPAESLLDRRSRRRGRAFGSRDARAIMDMDSAAWADEYFSGPQFGIRTEDLRAWPIAECLA